MSKLKIILGKILSAGFAPASIYVIIRYATYALQFVNSMLLAHCLGVYNFGVYSFALLLMQYMTYSNLGIHNALNTEYAVHKADTLRLNDIWNNAWSINILQCAVIAGVCCLIFAFNDNLFPEYQFNDYRYILMATCIIVNLSMVYTTYYRLHGRLFKLNVWQLLPNLAIFLLVLIRREHLTVPHIIITFFLCHLGSLILLRIGVPSVPRFCIDKELAKTLVQRGIMLMIYNFSFTFLTMLASSVVSARFAVDTFGCYSFANTLVGGVVMAGSAFMFVFYPKILNRLQTGSTRAMEVIRKLREVYIVFLDLISLISVLGIIAVSAIVPQYGDELVTIFTILMLGRIINNASAGYDTLFVARGKEQYLVIYSFLSCIPVAVCGGCVRWLDSPVNAIALSVVAASLVYSTLVIWNAYKLIGTPKSLRTVIGEIFGMNKWIVCSTMVVDSLFPYYHIALIVGIVVYCAVNMKNIRRAVVSGITVLSIRNVLDF